MGTRSLTYVYDSYENENGQNESAPIICMYRQFDGYPEGHGAELAEFLSKFHVGNGISGSVKMGTFANGMGCLAAQMVAHFKKDVGNIYLYIPELNKDCWQEYEYHVFENRVIVKNPSNVAFDGNWKSFVEFCSSDELA
jgi:hypothetical protein